MAATLEPGSGTNPGPKRLRSIRARAFLIGFLLCFPVCYYTTTLTQSHIFSLLAAPMGALILLILLNLPLRRWAPKLSLNTADLTMIFSITSAAAAVAGEWSWIGHAAIHMFPIHAEGNATIRDFFMKYMPEWLSVKDLDSVRDMAGGGRDWVYTLSKMPVLFPRYVGWGVLFCSICFACLCINSLMRGAWCSRERLAFPLIQLPVAMTENGGAGAMWKSRQMWIAFAVMFAIDMLNGLNYLYPNLPAIPTKAIIDLNTLFREPPLNQIGTFPINIYPFMAAIGLFMPSDLLVSMIVFYLLRKAAHVMIAAQGIPQGMFSGTFISPGPPYFDEQTWGGVLALFIGAIWVSRGYLREVWSQIKKPVKPEDGGLTHRWAFIGLLACFGVVVWYGMIGDLPIGYMVPYVALFLIFSVVLTRIRAQLGPPTHEFAFFGPNSIMHRFMGNQWLTDRQMVWVNQVFIHMNRIYRTHPMPYQLEAMKMGHMEGLNQKRIIWAMVGATVLGFFLAMFFLHERVYRTGQTWGWSDGIWYLETMRNNRKGPDLVGISMTLVGFAVVVILDAIRFRFPGFPLHPAGYVLSMNYGVDYYWFGLLLALLVKNFVQRYYGLKGYDKLRNVAFGILVGEYAAELIWMTMAIVTRQSTYTISFNDRSLSGL